MKIEERHGLLKVTFIVSIIAIMCKLLGFVREAIIASYYGANSATDAFFFSQSMPGMLFPAVCNSFSTAFISIYVTKYVQDDVNDSDMFASKSLITAIGISIFLSILAVIFAPHIVPIFAPGFMGNTLSSAIHLTRLTMSSFVLSMIQYMLSAILNSRKLFYFSQISGLMSNVFIIIVTIILGRNQSIDMLTITVIGGNIIRVILLIYYCKKSEVMLTLIANPFDIEVKRVIMLALPILLGNSIVQVNNIVDKALASNLTEGAISALSYSGALNNMVISIFITSLSTVLYPTLTEYISIGNIELYSKSLINSILTLTMILLPISIITIIFSQEIVSLVFKRGNFNEIATSLTSTALTYYAIMYVFYAIREVIIRGFYAIKDTKTPMINGVLGVLINIIFSLLFVEYIGIAGIALGTSISSIVTAILLILSARRKLINIKLYVIFSPLIKFIIASAIMIISMTTFTNLVYITNMCIRLSLVTIIGFISYLGTLILLKYDQLLLLLKRCKNNLLCAMRRGQNNVTNKR